MLRVPAVDVTPYVDDGTPEQRAAVAREYAGDDLRRNDAAVRESARLLQSQR